MISTAVAHLVGFEEETVVVVPPFLTQSAMVYSQCWKTQLNLLSNNLVDSIQQKLQEEAEKTSCYSLDR